MKLPVLARFTVRPPELIAAAANREFLSARVERTMDFVGEAKASSVKATGRFTRNELIMPQDYGLSPTNLGPRSLKTQVLSYENE